LTLIGRSDKFLSKAVKFFLQFSAFVQTRKLPFFMKEEQESQISIELSEEIAEGVYANLAMISHSPSEFVIDFIRLMPGVPKARVKSRIIVSPEHAKRLLSALKENVEQYEANFGKIKNVSNESGFPFNFGGAIGEA
jgi:hypothetical protein